MQREPYVGTVTFVAPHHPGRVAVVEEFLLFDDDRYIDAGNDGAELEHLIRRGTMTRKKTEAPPTGPTHNGRLIAGYLMELRKTGGEFSTKLVATNPELLKNVKVGDELTFAIKVGCVDEHFPAEKREDPAEGGVFQKFVFDTLALTVVNPETVERDFEAQAARLQQLEDDAQGNETIDSQLAQQHDDGEHTELVDGCVECEREAALADAEKAELANA